jgi:hypothetical protein
MAVVNKPWQCTTFVLIVMEKVTMGGIFVFGSIGVFEQLEYAASARQQDAVNLRVRSSLQPAKLRPRLE